MRSVVQRALSASVTVDNVMVSSIGRGMVVLAAIGPDDTVVSVENLAGKIVRLKLWDDGEGKMWKKSIADIDGEILCGNKPDFHGAAKPDVAKTLYERFFGKLQQLYVPSKVKDGVFQAMMQVALVNDGPVTIQMDNDPPKLKKEIVPANSEDDENLP